MLELYHHGSSVCAAKVRFALAEKRLDWTGHYVDILAGEQFKPEFLAVNAKAVVPVLIHDRRVIPESTVICEYLEEVFTENPIYPSEPYKRAEVRIWTKAVDEELHPACSAITYVTSHRYAILANGEGRFEEFLEQGGAEGRSARARKWQWIQQGLDAPGVVDQLRLYDGYLRKMEDCLREQDWLTGPAFTMADIAMAPYLNRLDMLAMSGLWTDGRMPHVEHWFDKVRARPAFAEALIRWVPPELAERMRENGLRSWPKVAAMLELEQ